MAAEFGLSNPQFTVFMVLGTGEPMTMGQIGEQSDLPTSSLTALVDRLVDLGHVNREAHPSDRRAIQVRLTDQGIELAGRVADETIRATAQITSDLGNDQIDATSEAIRLLMGGYRQYVAKQGRAQVRPLARRAGAGRSTHLEGAASSRSHGKARQDSQSHLEAVQPNGSASSSSHSTPE